MFTIARNEKINYFKNNRLLNEEVLLEQSDEWNSNPENKLEDKTDKNQLNKALGMISSDNRELIILSKYTGLPYS